MLVAVLTTACSDSDRRSTAVDASVDSGNADAAMPTSTPVDAGAETSSFQSTLTSDSTISTNVDDAGTAISDAGTQTTTGEPDGDAQMSGNTFPELPSVLSLAGCSGIGPLCSVSQAEGQLTLNCAGDLFTGTISEDGLVNLSSAPQEQPSGATVTRSCIGNLSRRGILSAECEISTNAVGETTATTEICSVKSKAESDVLPSVECMQAPQELNDVVICVEGQGANGQTISAGDCRVIQDGCAFQAECDNGQTLVGEVRGAELRFSQSLIALADAQAPAAGGEPAFLAGASVNHSCIATIDDNTLTGQCSAGGAGRGGSPTSVCAVAGSASESAQCAALAPSSELIFALDSCDPMKNGSEGVAGIGEPLCAFRQNNCVWEIQCGQDLVYTGQLEPGATTFEWKLDTGTQCEGGFDDAGEFTGVCAVPGLFSCNLWSKDAVPGGTSCPSAPLVEDVTSRGCGNGSGEGMVCRELMWHGCDFMAICSFSYLQSLVFAGSASERNGHGRLDFTGIGQWQCHVEAPTEADLSSDPYRASNEWIGQCETEEGGACRENFDPTTGAGFRGLQLFWGEGDEPNSTDSTSDTSTSSSSLDTSSDTLPDLDAGDSSEDANDGTDLDGGSAVDASVDAAI